MNKKLIALAVVAGLSAPGLALAEATVYGVAHVSIDSLDDGVDSNMNVSDNASRVGFKGSEDLGGGLKANFKVEAAVDLDDGGWNNNRNNYVGLSGGFGEVRVGHHDTPFKDIRSKHDVFGDRIGDLRNLTSGTDSWDLRFNNNVYYISPKLGGSVVVSGMYSTNQGTTTATGSTGNDVDATSISVAFKAGPVGVMLAHEQHNLAGGTDESGVRLGLKMGFGAATVNAIYQSLTDINGTSGSDQDVIGLNVAFKMGKNTLKAQYAMADDLGSSSNTGADLMAVGIDHSLSKRTTLYAVYAAVDNDSGADFSVTGGGGHEDNVGAAANGQDPSGISLGIVHKF